MLPSQRLAPGPDRRLSVAPMMDYTTRDYRYLARLISRHTLLYTEMVVAQAVIHGDRERLLGFDDAEHPVAVQLGGSDPAQMAAAAKLSQQAGYQEINLNIGCPSDRVQSGAFGACLMARPDLVADCVRSIGDAVDLPVTVKSRIGIDDMDSDRELLSFVETVAAAGCHSFILHARIAILGGLSPKENREVPPLNPDRVFLVKREFPELEIVINGGITTIEAAAGLLDRVDGVMVGREAYQNPWILKDVDGLIFAEEPTGGDRLAVMEKMLPYIRQELSQGSQLHHITRHLLGLFKGVPGGRQFRRHLSEHGHRKDAGLGVLLDALAFVS